MDPQVVDKASYHIADAGSWENAARHIALFLLFAKRRGLVTEDVDGARLEANPVEYLLNDWDGALIGREMLTDDGQAFASTHYQGYLEGYAAIHATLGGAGIYEPVDEAELRVELADWFADLEP